MSKIRVPFSLGSYCFSQSGNIKTTSISFLLLICVFSYDKSVVPFVTLRSCNWVFGLESDCFGLNLEFNYLFRSASWDLGIIGSRIEARVNEFLYSIYCYITVVLAFALVGFFFSFFFQY